MKKTKDVVAADNLEGVEAAFARIQEVLTSSRAKAWRAVNTVMVESNWQIGRIIVEEEQWGTARADYGTFLIQNLSDKLSSSGAKGYDRSNLWHMRNFYLDFPILDALRRELTWTHYRLLLKVERADARKFYENEAVAANWSTRELERQINSSLWERRLLNRDKEAVLEVATVGETFNPADLVHDPYVLEFTGLAERAHLREADLESALMQHLQDFLLELGKGFAFMARQQRITLDGEHFYIDLVFYNRMTRSVVLIDLKIGKLTHQDLGQMQMYVHYYEREQMLPGENPPIGIVLCADKSEAVVRYTLPLNNTQIFASRYQLYMPTEEELTREILRERDRIELEARLQDAPAGEGA